MIGSGYLGHILNVRVNPSLALVSDLVGHIRSPTMLPGSLLPGAIFVDRIAGWGGGAARGLIHIEI